MTVRPVCLLVEDDVIVRWVTSQMLDTSGYEVLDVSNADEAILALESRSDIRFLFTDVEMPGSMDGLKLAAAVRDRWPPIEIIVTTGRAVVDRSDLPDRAIFLPKPYDHANLVDALSRL